MIPRITKLSLILIAILFSRINAQYSLTVSDPQQSWYTYRGTIEEATISVAPHGLFSQVSTYLTFSSRGTNFSSSTQLEVVLRFDLPDGSFVTDLWLWIGEKISKGVLLDTWTASSIYEGIVNRRRDPGILKKLSAKSYELRVYPLLPNSTRKVKITYLVPNNWTLSATSVPLPLEMLKTSMYKIPTVKLVTWNNDEWKNAHVTNLENSFLPSSDSFFGNYLTLNLNNYDTFSSASIDYDNPMINGVYLKFFRKPSEGFYQLSLFPGVLLNVLNKKVLFLIDYDIRKSNTTGKQLLAGMKTLLKKEYTQSDYFNIFYSGLSIGKAYSTWRKIDSLSVDQTFNTITEKSLSSYSNLPTLLREGYDFINKNGGGIVYLISNSDQVGYYSTANQLVTDLNNMMNQKIPTYILDFNDKEIVYNYFNNRSYLGNEYFYDNLARYTGGIYQRISTSIDYSLVDVNQKLSGSISAFDLYTTLENGFCYGRQALNSIGTSISVSKAVTQVGKFAGNFPFVIKTSGFYNSNPFTQSLTLRDSTSSVTEELTEKMWMSSYISGLENGTITNSITNDIINLSKTNRILSKYTAFLSLENDTSYCADCYKDNGGNFSDVNDTKTELPKEFSVDAYPNPFNAQVVITVKLPAAFKYQDFTFKIYNILGQVVKTFTVKDLNNTGVLKFSWDGRNDFGQVVASGMYLFTVNGPGINRSVKLMFLK